LIIVDEAGKLVDGDQLMAAIAQGWKEDGRTLMSNLGLERYLQGLGLSLERFAVGDRYVLELMREQGFNLGGDQSGHIILLDHCTTGDGLVAALQLLAIVKRQGQPVSQVCRRFEPVPQILKNVRFKAGRPLADASVTRVIEDGSEKLGNSGRLIVRASGTEPVIRVMAEGDNLDLVERIVDDVCAALSGVRASGLTERAELV
jgi:phosphoglucosamine mutase